MTAHLPLTEATPHEVVIRTVYQIIRSDYRQNPEQYNHPATRLFDLALQWRAIGLDLIADSLQSCALHVANQSTIANWKSIQLAVGNTRVDALRDLGRSRRR